MQRVATHLGVPENIVAETLNKREVKAYIDSIYLDMGYRNRFKLAQTLDSIIDHKLAEAQESEVYTSKDLVDLLALAHKMRIDEIKALTDLVKAENANIKQQTNVQINESPFGTGNYAKLMEKLIEQG